MTAILRCDADTCDHVQVEGYPLAGWLTVHEVMDPAHPPMVWHYCSTPCLLTAFVEATP